MPLKSWLLYVLLCAHEGLPQAATSKQTLQLCCWCLQARINPKHRHAHASKGHLHLSSQQGHPAMQGPTWAATDTLPRRGNKRVTAPHVASPRVTRTQMAMVYMEHEELYSLIKDGKDAQVFIRFKKKKCWCAIAPGVLWQGERDHKLTLKTSKSSINPVLLPCKSLSDLFIWFLSDISSNR